MSEERKKLLFEQSDMIMILVNLAYIPDYVVKKIDFSRGWSDRFRTHMNDFKEKFAVDNGKPWEFQGEDNEKDFMDFKNEQA